MKKILFIDRDGTLIKEPEDTYQIDSFEKLRFIPFAISSLARIVEELDYELVMVTNQDGLGTNSFPEESFWPVQNMVVDTLRSVGVDFVDVFIDRSFEFENSPNRKPGTGMLSKYIYGEYDIANSYVIGDRKTDVQLAKNLGCKAIYLNNQEDADASLVTTCWIDVYQYLKKQPRKASIHRKTSETDITVELNIDGRGVADINTGLGFFDHMLCQIAKHGSIDLIISAKGDLSVDEHHTIEDVAIVVGEAFLKSLGSKKGINRYGFLLPMDDSLALVAIDFGGRPWLEWSVDFKREKIGDVPTELFYHFFKSFSDSAKCNLNIKCEGVNEHHKAEAIFKAFAKAIRMATKQNESFQLPTTKGVL